MTTQYTSPYLLPYPQGADPVKDGAAVMELLAKRVNQVLQDGTFPASTPDVLLLTDRLNQLEAKKLIFRNTGASWAGGLLVQDAGTLSVDATTEAASQMTSPQPAFAVPGSASGTLKFTEAGIYTVQWMTAPTGNPGAQGLRIQMYGTWPGSPSAVAHTVFGQALKHDTTIYWENMVQSREIRVPTANLEIRFVGQQVNATTSASEVYVTKVGGI